MTTVKTHTDALTYMGEMVPYSVVHKEHWADEATGLMLGTLLPIAIGEVQPRECPVLAQETLAKVQAQCTEHAKTCGGC